MSMQKEVEHLAETQGAQDAAKGLPARPDAFSARKGSAWETWYLRGYTRTTRTPHPIHQSDLFGAPAS